MGQQQLLLLVFGIVIVGIAVIAGFEAADKKLRQLSVDNLVNRNLAIASEAIFWKTKRDPYAGGNASFTGLETDGMQKLFLGEYTENGYFKITNVTDATLEITAVSNSYPEIGVRTFVTRYSIDSTSISYAGDITSD